MGDNHDIAFVKFPDEELGDIYVKSDLVISIASGEDYMCIVRIKDAERCAANARPYDTHGVMQYTVSAKSVAAMKLVVLSHGKAVVKTIISSDDNIEQTIHEAITDALEA